MNNRDITIDRIAHPDARAFFAAPGRTLGELDRSGRLPAVLKRLQGVPQPADSHPEGDVWTHTCLVVEQTDLLAKRHGVSEPERLVLILAALTHDLGKAETTEVGADGRIRSWKHEQPEVYLPLYRELSAAWNLPEQFEIPVQTLVSLHLPNAVLQQQNPSEREVKQFLKKLATGGVGFLLARLLIAADQSGRNRGEHDPLASWEPIVTALNQSTASPQAIRSTITGDDLIAGGFKPGPRFRALLARAEALATAGKSRAEIFDALRKET